VHDTLLAFLLRRGVVSRPPIDGATVLLTGASSGIGLELAKLFALRSKCLVLVARRRERLEAHGVTIDVLVNNAGVGLMGMFDRSDPLRVRKMIDLNVTSLVALTHACVRGMVARGRGGILSISSGAGLTLMPGFAAYVGTKHFVTGFSEALRCDLSGTGVTVTQVCPGPVATEFEETAGNFTGVKVPGFVQITAAHCAKASFSGFSRGKAIVVPGFVMSILLAFSGMTPRWLVRAYTAFGARFLRKKEASVRP
jgi:short-subunit dehydrogenase